MERINRFIRELADRQWQESIELKDWQVTLSRYRLPGDYTAPEPFAGSESFALFPSVQGNTYFFRTAAAIPQHWQGTEIGLRFLSGGEGLLRVNGASCQGLDRNHTFVSLNPEEVGWEPQLEIELYDAIPEPDDPLNKQAVIQPPVRAVSALLVQVNPQVQSLMHTVIVIRDAARLLPDSDFRRTRLTEALLQAMDAWDGLGDAALADGEKLAGIEEALRGRVSAIGSNGEGRIHMIGQSHIDIAWLWPARETVRKTSRTFSTVNALMEEFPHFRYAQSQPQLFAYLKDNDPELYGKVKARIREGRWELVGGMWVEPDLNIPSGESLMRQMLYGQNFYQEEFGLRSNIEWLPDTFGYCASLPQILKHGGIEYFMTTKLGWNDTNVFPYDLFHWVGIDGTPMLSFMNHGVNENTLPKDIHDHWQSYREKAAHPEQMLLYGHGDGGGGVTREMLEQIERSGLMVGQPEAVYSTAAEFFEGIRQADPKLPVWQGDLYLELHRGTYTTHARNKRNNRKAEGLYREAELWQALARQRSMEGLDEASGHLHEGWKLILLNQFHDIIPGSAITEVYETSEKEYGKIFALGNSALDAGTHGVTAGIDTRGEGQAYVVLNSLGWKRDIRVELAFRRTPGTMPAVCDEQGHVLETELLERESGSALRVRVPEVPALGYTTVWVRAEITHEHEAEDFAEAANTDGLLQANKADDAGVTREAYEAHEDHAVGEESYAGFAKCQTLPQPLGDAWETGFYRLTFNERGEIVGLYDKEAEREIVKPGEAANRFHFFHDRPTLWDAWDIDSRYEQQRAGEAALIDKQVKHTGSLCDILAFRWQIGQSVIEQQLILYHHDRRIDFKTKVDWNEAHKLLKVGFPVAVNANKATYEIPFGTIERVTHRNTSWEQAQYEVCGHRFADVGEYGYGVSLLNDCKYGYDVQGSTIRLSLLRAPKWPDVTADLGEHEFTYALYPHLGDWREALTLRAAAELNHAEVAVACPAAEGERPSSGSMIGFDGKHVVLDTVKPSEDGTASILRLYESAGGRETVTLRWPQPSARFYASNALEEELELLPAEDGLLRLSFTPYQIQTIRIVEPK
ncbi:alpha-mannosidase [Paenibacillus sp. NFR01]|uniref:alpha-mannosidase n=1 Tax=Paenibacillus sp. NFR01 TaxID=1566279 RepID=UPI0008D4976C|nr:glycoside hydrolase family 38 C-terminal domain-containing protein [Paenibacillus sp. NFR01]SET10712.1 alpha-mannosidase [Paenibacillus sp. NFR01]